MAGCIGDGYHKFDKSINIVTPNRVGSHEWVRYIAFYWLLSQPLYVIPEYKEEAELLLVTTKKIVARVVTVEGEDGKDNLRFMEFYLLDSLLKRLLSHIENNFNIKIDDYQYLAHAYREVCDGELGHIRYHILSYNIDFEVGAPYVWLIKP